MLDDNSVQWIWSLNVHPLLADFPYRKVAITGGGIVRQARARFNFLF